jgi:hypothetical protein
MKAKEGTAMNPEDEARKRARPFRILQAVQIADIVIGLVVYLLAERIPVPGELFGLAVMEFVGLALIVIGVTGFALFEALARKAAAG